MKQDSGTRINAKSIALLAIAISITNIAITSRKIERNNTTDTIIQTEKQKHVLSREDTINAMAMAFAQQESNFDSRAVSPCGQWVGCLQLSKIMVREANRVLGEELYSYNDRYDADCSYGMFKAVMEYHNPNLDIENAINLWNGHAPQSYRDNVKAYFYANLENFSR